MKNTHLINKVRSFAAPYRISKGGKFRLKDFDPGDTGGLSINNKARAAKILKNGVKLLADFQDVLYAQDRWSILLIFQAMDAAGKDGAIKHVMSGINPQGCQVYSFKSPSAEELDHDYMWRCLQRMPQRGHIGIFNRSYYEETLVVRVHPEYLENEKIPPELVTKNIWLERYQDIRGIERYLSRNGTIIRKFFLNVSKKEQKKRFLDRLDNRDKNWKFSSGDSKEREHWNDYMHAYEEMIQHTATEESPWYVVPADNKWFTRIVVAGAVIDALASLKLTYPKVSKEKQTELKHARAALAGTDHSNKTPPRGRKGK